MQNRYSRYLVALSCVQQFLEERSAQFERINASFARGALDETIARLKQLAALQMASCVQSRGGRAAEFKLRKELVVRLLRPIDRFARSQLPKGGDVARVRAPHGDVSTMAVVIRAREIADFVDTHKAIFASLAPQLSQRVRAGATALERAIAHKATHRGERVRATAEIERAVAQARQVIGVLSAMVCAQYGDDGVLMLQWRRVTAVPAAHTKN